MTTTSERLAGSEQARGLTPETPRYEALDRTMNDSLRRLMESVRPDGIFGATVEREGVTLIPCAEVITSFGIGGGAGFGPAPANRGQQAQQTATTGEAAGAQPTSATGGGSGLGGGGGARGRPVAVVVVSEGKARVLPVVDVTRFMLAAMTTAGIIAFLIGQTIVARSGGRRSGAMSAMRLARAIRGPLGRNV
jgi:uncharacterized spore protein YtfJ